MSNKIHFFTEDIDFVLPHKIKVRTWLSNLVKLYDFNIKEINFIFCSDAYLLTMNQQYLQHDTLTDIITFDHSETKGKLESDIFISVERTNENAHTYGITPLDELHRVMAHGVLHLLGFKDKNKSDKALMTQKENEALALRTF